MKADSLFNKQEKQKIAATIKNIETRTSGEVAVMVVDASDTYPEASLLAGTILGGLLSLVLTDLFFNASLWFFLPLFLVLAIVTCYFCKFFPIVKSIFLPAGRREQQVEARAVQAFYEKELYKTRDQTGVLFFISLFEHKVWVLADKGIYEKISQPVLQEYAHTIAAGIKSDSICAHLCQAITNVGIILAEHFPIKEDDTNELANEVIIN